MKKTINEIYQLINPILANEFEYLRRREREPSRTEKAYILGEDLVTKLDAAGVFDGLDLPFKSKLGYILRSVKSNEEFSDIEKFQMYFTTKKGKRSNKAAYTLKPLPAALPSEKTEDSSVILAVSDVAEGNEVETKVETKEAETKIEVEVVESVVESEIETNATIKQDEPQRTPAKPRKKRKKR